MQVNVTIGDVNDNAPEFDGVSVRISVPEDADTRSGVALYAVHAQDADDGANGRVSYRLVDGKPSYGLEAFRVDAKTGVVTLVRNYVADASLFEFLPISLSKFKLAKNKKKVIVSINVLSFARISSSFRCAHFQLNFSTSGRAFY